VTSLLLSAFMTNLLDALDRAADRHPLMTVSASVGFLLLVAALIVWACGPSWPALTPP
jgi:hypothetical protein